MSKPVQTPDEFFDSLAKATVESQSTVPTEPAQTTETEETVETEETTEESVEVEEPNEPSEQSTEQVPDQPAEEKTDGLIDDWEGATPTESKVPDVNLYEQLSKDLGVENITKEQIVEALKPKEDTPIVGIPDDLALLVNLAKSGVDYKEYVSLKNADYSAYDDRTLVEHSVRDAMKDAEGKLSEEAVEQINEYLEDMTPMDFKIRGNQIRQQLNSVRDARIQQIESQAQKFTQNSDAELKSSLDSFNEVAGFKVQPHHKKSLFDRISKGEALAKLIYKPDGTYDYNKVVKAVFVMDYFDKMVDYHKTRAATNQKREMINRTANVNTSVNQTPPNPEAPKIQDGLDKFVEWAKSLNAPPAG